MWVNLSVPSVPSLDKTEKPIKIRRDFFFTRESNLVSALYGNLNSEWKVNSNLYRVNSKKINKTNSNLSFDTRYLEVATSVHNTFINHKSKNCQNILST